MLFLFKRHISSDVPELHHNFLGFWQCEGAELQELNSGERGMLASIPMYYHLPVISQDLSYSPLNCLPSGRFLVCLVLPCLGSCSKASL